MDRMDSKDRTPVVVGMGVVSPAGNSIGEFANNIFDGKVGNIRQITKFDASAFEVRIAGEVAKGEEFDGSSLDRVLQVITTRQVPQDLVVSIRKAWRNMDDYTKYAILAGVQAAEQAGPSLDYKVMGEEAVISALSNPVMRQEERIRAVLEGTNRVPVIIGSGYGGLESVLKGETVLKAEGIRGGPSRVPARLIQESMINSPASRLASIYQFLGENFGVSNACASGTQAIIEAALRILKGEAEGALAVGADALEIGITMAAFTNAGALSRYGGEPRTASRPWDGGRKGFVLSEGAAAIYMVPRYLAEEKGIKVLAVLAGWDGSSDGNWNINNMAEPNVRGPLLSMARPLGMAGLLDIEGGLARLAYINAHATATTDGDLNEALAITYLLGEYARQVPVGSTKSITGHMLGGAGVVESIACILALQRGLVPGNVNLDSVDPKIAATGINLPTQTVQMRKAEGPRYALSNSFGFGGANATVVWKEA